jgi:2-amino-4-hydroxy-6-hydroxymethyldihydropteridine diphosphokinase
MAAEGRVVACIGLGSNLGRRAANLARARRLLAARGVEILAASSIYETEPVDFEDQPRFLNQVLEVRTRLGPRALLRLAKTVEAEMKRVPTVAKGPRTIDIDILLAGDMVVETPDLVIPHPRLHRRNFVLIPLAEIAPDARHPVLGRTIRDLAEASPDRACVARLTPARNRRFRCRSWRQGAGSGGQKSMPRVR